jgi:hypothetical protein
MFMTGDDDSSGPSSPGPSSPGPSSPGPSSESVSDEPEPAPTTSSVSAALEHRDLPDFSEI